MDIKLINKIVQIIKLSLDNNVDLDTLLNNIFSLLAEEYGLNINLRIEETCEECETRRGCVDKEKTIILYRKGIDNSILEESAEFSFLTDKDVENNTKLLFHTKSEVKYKVDEFGHSDIEFNDAYNAEHEYFEKNYKDLYKPVFDYLYNLNSNTLILFDRINIGKNLFEYAKEIYKDKNVFYIDGSIDVKDREETRAKFEQCDGNLLIA